MKRLTLRRSWASVVIALAAAAFQLPAQAASAAPGFPINIGQSYQIESAVMAAPVTYLVHTPRLYARTDKSYPIVILLDGSDHFAHVSAAIDFLSDAGRIPEMILVGVNNVNRAANLRPPLTHPTAGTPNDPDTPNADRFLRFISEELIPQIDRTYRSRPYRVLMGHSLGGLFVIYSLLQKPEVFNGYIAISPILAWDNGALINATPPFLAGHNTLRADLFLSLANEPGELQATLWRFSALLAEKTPAGIPGLRWRLNQYPEDSHGSVSLRAMEEGLRSVFDGWYLNDTDALALYDLGGLAAVQKHYAGVSERMGYAIPVPAEVFTSVAFGLYRQKRIAEERPVLEQAIATYPNDALLYFVLGQWYVGTGDRARGLEYFAKSLQASPIDYRDSIAGQYKVDPITLLPEIAPAKQALQAYAGTYRAADDSRRIRAKASALVMSGSAGDCEVRFLSELKFYCGSEWGTFEKESDGQICRLSLRTDDSQYTLTRLK
jgi:uncharacterized protein